MRAVNHGIPMIDEHNIRKTWVGIYALVAIIRACGHGTKLMCAHMSSPKSTCDCKLCPCAYVRIHLPLAYHLKVKHSLHLRPGVPAGLCTCRNEKIYNHPSCDRGLRTFLSRSTIIAACPYAAIQHSAFGYYALRVCSLPHGLPPTRPGLVS